MNPNPNAKDQIAVRRKGTGDILRKLRVEKVTYQALSFTFQSEDMGRTILTQLEEDLLFGEGRLFKPDLFNVVFGGRRPATKKYH